jgi:NAD dependent epimerase/dehydratase family enzyme
VMKRPHWLPAPGFMMRLLFGEMADLLLKGQRVLPQKALANGFSFTYNTLEEALKELV